MRITDYTFGKITIRGQTYTSDVIIYPDSVNDRWWRKEGHKLQIEDLTDIVNVKPEGLIIGTGYHGCMTVPKETLQYLAALGIQAHVVITRDAVALYNQLQRPGGVIVAALHLTC